MRPIVFLSTVGLCLVLGACSDEPSEAAMRQATSDLLTRGIQARLAATNFMMGGSRGSPVRPIPVISSFSKLGCVSAAPAAIGHVCEFEVEIDGTTRGRDKGRFYKDASGVVTLTQ